MVKLSMFDLDVCEQLLTPAFKAISSSAPPHELQLKNQASLDQGASDWLHRACHFVCLSHPLCDSDGKIATAAGDDHLFSAFMKVQHVQKDKWFL